MGFGEGDQRRDIIYAEFQSSSPTRYLIYCKYEQYFFMNYIPQQFSNLKPYGINCRPFLHHSNTLMPHLLGQQTVTLPLLEQNMEVSSDYLENTYYMLTLILGSICIDPEVPNG